MHCRVLIELSETGGPEMHFFHVHALLLNSASVKQNTEINYENRFTVLINDQMLSSLYPFLVPGQNR